MLKSTNSQCKNVPKLLWILSDATIHNLSRAPFGCFTVSLESTPFISSSASFWYQCLHFQLTYSFTNHFFLFCFTTLLIHNSLSFTTGLKPTWFTDPMPSSTSSSRTAFMDFCLRHFFCANQFLILVFPYFSVSGAVRQIKLALPSAF